MFRMHKRPPENANGVSDSEIFILRRMLDTLEPLVLPEVPAQPQPAALPNAAASESLDSTKSLVCEQRKLAERVLQELVDLERRLEIAPAVHDADAAYAAAREKAENLAAAVDRTRDDVVAAATSREASATQLREAEELVAGARSEVRSGADAVAELELMLAQARKLASQMEAAFLEREEQSRECAAAERDAALRETQLREMLAGQEANLAAAREEARQLQNCADELRTEALAEAAPRLDRVGDMARQLAELKP